MVEFGPLSDPSAWSTDPRWLELYRAENTSVAIAKDNGVLRAFELPAGDYLVRASSWSPSYDIEAFTVTVTTTSPVPTLERADYTRLAGEGSSSLQYSPSGQLVQLLWFETPWFDKQLVYRVREIDGSFTEETIMTTAYSFGWSFARDVKQAQLLFQSDGTPHVLLFSSSSQISHYVRDVDGWRQMETLSVPTGTRELRQMAGAVGPDDSLHVFVTAGTPGTASYYWYSGIGIYGTNASGSWQFEEAVSPAACQLWFKDFPAEYPRFISLAVDSQNYAHVAYTPEFLDNGVGGWARPFDQLAYATNKTGSWVTQIVHQPADDSGQSGMGASIAIGLDDQPAIAQFYIERVSTGSAQYARLLYHQLDSTGTWTTETVVSGAAGYEAGDGSQFTGYAPILLV